MGSGDRLWALIGIGKPRDTQHQRMLEIQARRPFDSFPNGFFGYVKKSEFIKAVTNKTQNPAENFRDSR
jgi:hypothetical protein